MEQLLYESSHNIKMVRKDLREYSQVRVFHEGPDGKRHYIKKYRFDRTKEQFQSPYCSWENLDHCGGWACDDTYLDTAVQEGKKLYAARLAFFKSEQFPEYPAKHELLSQFEELKSSLPDGVIADIEYRDHETDNILYTFICRQGCIADYFDLEEVFDFYEKIGFPAIRHYDSHLSEIKRLCHVEIASFGRKDRPFNYMRASTYMEMITTGLLLGYPPESTISLIMGF